MSQNYRRRHCNFYKHIEPESFIRSEINPLQVKNIIYHKDARNMSELPDRSIQMIITSPPYNAGKEYEDDLPLDVYLALLHDVWSECYRVLINGGRIAVNCPLMIGRTIPVPISVYVCQTLMRIGFRFRTIYVWEKGWGAGKGTAWGSWMSPSNPYTYDTSELIYVFSKGCAKRLERGMATISREDFLTCTRGTWFINTESNRRHPAPFPIELPRRLIEFYTYKDEVVLDPFMGSGSTAIAAIKTKRHFVGYEIKEEYVKLARAKVYREIGAFGLI